MEHSKSAYDGNPFNWRNNPEPSIFAKDPLFKARSDGKTNSQAQSEAISRRVANGESPGTVLGMSPKADERLRSKLAYKQFGGAYSKAKPSSVRVPNKHEK